MVQPAVIISECRRPGGVSRRRLHRILCCRWHCHAPTTRSRRRDPCCPMIRRQRSHPWPTRPPVSVRGSSATSPRRSASSGSRCGSPSDPVGPIARRTCWPRSARPWAGPAEPEALTNLDRAVVLSRGALSGRVLLRRADVLLVLGRHREALDDLRSAITRLRRSGDQVWEARSRNYRGFIQLALGGTKRADAGLRGRRAPVRRHRPGVRVRRSPPEPGIGRVLPGRPAGGAEILDEAGRRFAAVGVAWPDSASAGGACCCGGSQHRALAEMDQAIVQMEAEGGTATKRGELWFAAATAARRPATWMPRGSEPIGLGGCAPRKAASGGRCARR